MARQVGPLHRRNVDEEVFVVRRAPPGGRQPDFSPSATWLDAGPIALAQWPEGRADTSPWAGSDSKTLRDDPGHVEPRGRVLVRHGPWVRRACWSPRGPL